MLATCVYVIIVAGIALVSMVYPYVMIKTNWLPTLVLGRGSKMSMATDLSEPADVNNFNFL